MIAKFIIPPQPSLSNDHGLRIGHIVTHQDLAATYSVKSGSESLELLFHGLV